MICRLCMSSDDILMLLQLFITVFNMYEGESISNQPNLFPVEMHLFSFDVIAL